MNEEKEQNTIKYLKREVELDPNRKSGETFSTTDIQKGPPVQQKRLVVRGVSTTFQTFKSAKIDFANGSSADVKPANEGNISRNVDEPCIPPKQNIGDQFRTKSSSEASDYKLDSPPFTSDNLQEPDIDETNLRNHQRVPNFSKDSQYGNYNGTFSNSNNIEINNESKSQKFYQDKLKYHNGFNGSTNTRVLDHQEDLNVSRLSSSNGGTTEIVSDQRSFGAQNDQQIIQNTNGTTIQNTENKSKISLSSLFTTHLNDKNSDVKLEPIRVVERVIVKNVEKKEKEENVIIRTIKSFLFSILQFVGCLLFLVLSILFVLIIYINFL